ncbi:ferric reductase-like transmembrane domain-containing protein [Nocardia africana]|uniref:Ferric reductase-like transmembrane domain-containing protein n=1 Tax=Nocardia africana TaxID=134964 RepID=A0ABW6NQ98_9NOCA
MTSPWLWYVSRAAGVVTLVLLTLVALLGMFTAARVRPRLAVSAVAMGLHRALALGLIVFLAAHIVTATVDTYVDLGWVSTVVPFTAGYERQWVALGTLAADIFLAVVATSLLRHRLPTWIWRAVHLLAYVMAPLAVVHGLTMASAQDPALFAVTVACGVALAAGAVWRWALPDADRHRRSDIAAQEWT